MTITMAAADQPDNISTMMSTILLGFDNVALGIATFLPAKDVLTLHTVNRGWHGILTKHDESLFKQLLTGDFVEGEVLSYVARKDNLSCKKLYRAFLQRWSLPKPLPPWAWADESTRVCVPWTRPDAAVESNGDSNINDLVFIARVGDVDNPKTCAVLEWNPDYDHENRLGGDNNDQLCIDKCWKECTGGLLLEQDSETNLAFIEDGERSVLEEAHTLTLHAIDTRHYQVATLMDTTPTFQNVVGGEENEADFYTRLHAGYGAGYGDSLPKLYGIPPKGSPYYRDFTDRDFKDVHGRYDEYVHSIAYMPVFGGLELDSGTDDEGDYTLLLHDDLKGLNFNFDKDQYATVTCSFLRALMKEKCARGEAPLFCDVSDVGQPVWVHTDKILDRVTSFASFEDQAGKLRLVCRQFGASALRQLENKLDKTKVIGFDRGECGTFFKASVRHGWSEKSLTNEESTVDDALWLAKCRCCANLCKDKESCPDREKSTEYTDRKGKSTTLDTDWARGQLVERGRFQVDGKYCKSKCSFKREEMSIYQLCEKVKDIIHSSVQYVDDGGEWGEYYDFGIPSHFQRFYGVSKSISSKQFIRSLFLVFTKAAKAAESLGENATKRARMQRNEEVTIGAADATTKLCHAYYSRTMTIFRFYSATHEPMEICLEYYGGWVS